MSQEMFVYKEKEIDLTHLPSVKVFVCKPVTRRMVAPFIEKWHYSGNMNGVRSDYCFGLYYQHNLIGAAVFAQPATPGVAEAYNDNGNLNLTELRRLCCIDKTPRNTESYFIGQMLQWLRKNTIVDMILSYADRTHGHEGIIYKATNFELVGQSPAVDKILYKGKLYHDKSLRTYYGDKLKPFSVRLAKALESGAASWQSTKPKNIYIMKIRRKLKTPVNLTPRETDLLRSGERGAEDQISMFAGDGSE